MNKYRIKNILQFNNLLSQPPMEPRINYIQMANQINNMDVYKKLYQEMSSFDALEQIFLHQCEKSSVLLFTACQILSKKLINRQLITSNDDIDVQVENNTLETKKFTLFSIASKLYAILGNSATTNSLPNYIARSCINAISLCIHSSLLTTSSMEPMFVNYLKLLAPDFAFSPSFIKPVEHVITFVGPSQNQLGIHHQYVILVLRSLLDYIVNSTYFENFYYFRRNLYSFRNHYLAYYLNYSIFALKSVFRDAMANSRGSAIGASSAIRSALKLLEQIVTYPFSLNIQQFEIEDQIHENISGLQSQIYFPSYFRNLLCDTGFLMDLIGYYSRLTTEALSFDPVKQDIYSLIRIIGRILCTSEYVFMGEQEKKAFRTLTIDFVTRILKQNKFFDSYLILCITKINIKFMSIQNQVEMFGNRKQYFNALKNFILVGISKCQGKIEDGDKHPIRQIFQLLTAFVNISANTVIDYESKACAQQTLNILFSVKLMNNQQNKILMKQFGYSNTQEIECFKQIFSRIPEIFKINLPVNLTLLHELDLSLLNSQSLTFWLHMTALLLPQHDTSVEQTQLIIKFLEAAITARSIASLHYIKTLVEQILFQVKDGVSTTYLWRFIEDSKKIKFDEFLSYIIRYSMKILIQPNYALIDNCLGLFKTMFLKLCHYRHQSFVKYFEIIEQVCNEIDKTMLVRPEYTKLRIDFFSIISIIWVSEGQVGFVYRIFKNIRQNLRQNADLMHFMRYLTDITGLIDPVQSSQVYKILMELVLVDMHEILPYYFGTPERLAAAFSQEIFLKTFIRFIYTIVNDNGFRMTHEVHTEVPFQIEQIFRPYLIQALKYDYPKKMVDLWCKFIKLNPMGPLLPLDKSLKLKGSPCYRSLVREYFENLHRLSTPAQFLYIYSFIDDNIDSMVDWWEEVMIQEIRVEVNVREVVNARIWTNLRQKEHLAKLLFRIAKYDERYWKIECDATTQSKYAEWFTLNYK